MDTQLALPQPGDVDDAALAVLRTDVDDEEKEGEDEAPRRRLRLAKAMAKGREEDEVEAEEEAKGKSKAKARSKSKAKATPKTVDDEEKEEVAAKKKAKAKAKSKAKAKQKSRAKAKARDDEGEEEKRSDDDDEEEEPKAKAKARGKRKGRARRKKEEDDEENDDCMEEDEDLLKRDRVKARKFFEMYDSLPGETKAYYESLEGRSEKTRFINSAFKKKKRRGKLVEVPEILFKQKSEREDEKKNKEKLDGLILEEALVRVGGSQAALDGAVRGGRVLVQKIGELPIYFFPRFSFAQSQSFRESVEGSKDKVADHGLPAIEEGFSWPPATFLPQGPSSKPLSGSSQPMSLANFPTLSLPCGGAAQPIMSTPLVASIPTDSEVKNLTSVANDVNKLAAGAMRLIQVSESTLAKVKLSGSEEELVNTTLDQLRAAALEAEELSMPLGKAMKFQKIEMDGGWSSQNVSMLGTQGKDLVAKLSTCMKLAKAVMPSSRAVRE